MLKELKSEVEFIVYKYFSENRKSNAKELS